jgi:hypothetical protein
MEANRISIATNGSVAERKPSEFDREAHTLTLSIDSMGDAINTLTSRLHGALRPATPTKAEVESAIVGNPGSPLGTYLRQEANKVMSLNAQLTDVLSRLEL